MADTEGMEEFLAEVNSTAYGRLRALAANSESWREWADQWYAILDEVGGPKLTFDELTAAGLEGQAVTAFRLDLKAQRIHEWLLQHPCPDAAANRHLLANHPSDNHFAEVASLEYAIAHGDRRLRTRFRKRRSLARAARRSVRFMMFSDRLEEIIEESSKNESR